jgi:aldehyde:ferredoxin oxidoreductase
MAGPTDDRLIRVDMTHETVSIEPYPDAWRLLGGRALSARILLEECDPGCDPLGPDNVLVLAPGVLSGTSAPTSGRLSVGGKSPLTAGIKEANVGGNPGQDLMKLGYRAIVVTGQPADGERRYALDVDAEGGRLVAADEYKGRWNYALIEDLARSYSATASFISVGPAGEMRLKGASVACTDAEQERRPARHAGRGGLGAVMGSKGLKYISVDPGKRPARKPARTKEFYARCKKYTKYYLDGPAKEPFPKWGTSAIVSEANMLYTFPYKNRVEGRTPDVETLDGMRIVESFEERGGGMHNCMTGCIVRCSNIVNDADGNYKTSALEFETLTLLGSNCGIASWEDVADLDRLCDEVGVDGDADGSKRILREIAEGTELGRAIGDGAVSIGRKRKHHRIPHVKGQAIPAWDPRPLKAAGVTYCTSPMGADHTAGLVVEPGQPYEEAVRASQESQIVNAVIDSSGFCQFLMTNLDEIREFYGHLYDQDVTREQISDLGWRCLEDEWEFNRRAGLGPNDDLMPECMKQDAIGPGKLVWDLPPELVARAYKRFEAREELFELRPS